MRSEFRPSTRSHERERVDPPFPPLARSTGSGSRACRGAHARGYPKTSCALLCLFAAILAFSGCAKHETPVARGNRDQVLLRGIGPEPASLDPHLATQAADYSVLSALFEGLVAEDPVDLHPVPGVAERWDLSPDGLTYTFHLRANARWSNGDPVTAQDFAASWRRVLTPSLAAENAYLLYIVRGAEAFHRGQSTDFASVGIAAPDALTFVVTLAHPAPYFLSMLNHPVWFPVHVPTIEKNGPAAQRGNPWARPGSLVGNGPFVLREWRAGQRIVVARSPTYWDAAAVRLSEIDFYPFTVDAEERAFRAGQLHVTDALPPAKIDAYRRDAPRLLRIDPLLGTYFYRLNIARPPLNDVRVRRALSLAVDRQAIVEKILRGDQLPASAFTPPGMAGYTPSAGLATDFAMARRLLAAAGFPGGNGLPPLELLFNSSESHRAIAEAVQETWRRELGVEVRLVNMENNSVLDARRTGSFQILRSSWSADFADPQNFLALWTNNSGNNFTGWTDPAYDALLRQAELAPDPTHRFALLQQAEARLLDAAPVIPIYYYTHVFLLQPSVQGWPPTLLDHHPYKHVWLEE
jgi:oligopeptide transport system substrate-binding protein